MGRLVKKIYPKKNTVMQWHTKAGNITTNLKVELEFTWPAISAKNDVTRKCHVYESDKGSYNTILGRDLLTKLWLNLKLSDHVIEADDGNFKGSTIPMVDLGMYEFKDWNIGKITPEDFFTNAYAEEVYEPEHVRTATKLLHVMLDAK